MHELVRAKNITDKSVPTIFELVAYPVELSITCLIIEKPSNLQKRFPEFLT
ncbi:MAG: hypothetical protein ACREOW_15445 [Thermodesulfobacteriota bacterium]